MHNSGLFTSFSPPGVRLDYTLSKTGGSVQFFPPSWGGNQAPLTNTPGSISARKDGYQIAQLTVQGMRAFDSTSSQWTTPDAYAGNMHDPMSQKPFMWNKNNSLEYSDPTGYDPYVIFDPQAAAGFGHVEIAIIDPKTGKGTLWSAGPEHNGHAIDKMVITKQAVTLNDVRHMQSSGETVLTEHTTSAQDSAMNSTAAGRYSTQSNEQFNVANYNCDQFTRQVLGAGDSTRASEMSSGIPRSDVLNLEVNKMPLMDDSTTGQNRTPRNRLRLVKVMGSKVPNDASRITR
jgi:hypothetical protein